MGPIVRITNPHTAETLPAESLRFPISSNSICKDEGELLRPKPSFPFSNCFHTIGNELHVRVEIRCEREPGYSLVGIIELPYKDHQKIEFSLPYGTIRGSLDDDDLPEGDSDDEWLDPGEPYPEYVRPGIDELNASNWGDPIVDIWLQLDKQFSESCIPETTQNIGEEMEEVQQ